MSYDLLILNTAKRLTHAAAVDLFGRLCMQDFTDLLPTPRIDVFYDELTGMYPEIDETAPEDLDRCPWSCAIERSPGHLHLQCVWSRADEIDLEVRSLAARHGLAVFDPQQVAVTYPDAWDAAKWTPVEAPPGWKGPPSPLTKRPWWRFWRD
jgi:hypothetical protein